MARLSQDFIERTRELQGTVAARASARVTAWALRSAAHTGDDHFDALARRVTSSPTRFAGLMSGDHDPMLLCALAGRRSMQDLAGVAPAGGRSQAAPTVLESCAVRRVQEHWELCRTEPEKAKRVEATWAAGRATMRSGYMGPPLAAMEATFGAACSAEREAAQGRLVSTVPPASWNPAGAHAGRLPGYGSARWNRMRAEAVAETEVSADWRPRRGNDAADRPRARFVARGAGRSQQLADSRFSPRMAVSRIAFQYRLKRAMARGPAATRRFLHLCRLEPAPGRCGGARPAGPDGGGGGSRAQGDRGDAGRQAGTGAGTARPAAGRVAQAGRGASGGCPGVAAGCAGGERAGCGCAAGCARRRPGVGQGDAGCERRFRRQGVARGHPRGPAGRRLECGQRAGRAVRAGACPRQPLRRLARSARGGGRGRRRPAAAAAVRG